MTQLIDRSYLLEEDKEKLHIPQSGDICIAWDNDVDFPVKVFHRNIDLDIESASPTLVCLPSDKTEVLEFFFPIESPKPIFPLNKPDPSAVDRHCGALARLFPPLEEISDEEIEQVLDRRKKDVSD